MVKRVLMTAHQYEQGGVGKVVGQLAAHLNGQGVEVDVLEKQFNQPYVLHKSDNSQVVANSFAQMERIGFDIASYDLLHIHSINLSWEGALEQICKKADIPKVYTAHSIVRHEKSLYDQNGEKVPCWITEDIKAQDSVVHSADKMILLTETGKKIAQQHYSKPVEVIPNGIDSVEVDEKLVKQVRQSYAPNEEGILLYVGRITPDKGIKELVDAFPRIQNFYKEKTGKQMKLVLVGPEQEEGFRDSVENSIPKEYRNSVTFVGEVRDKERMAAFYRAANWHILPTKHDSFPGVTLEAMSHGTPAIATKVDGLINIIEDKKNGLHIIPKSLKSRDLEDGIVDTMKYAIENPEVMSEIAANAKREVLQKYQWKDIASRVSREYDKVIQAHIKPEKMQIGAAQENVDLKGKRIGVIGHFAYRNGDIPDGVARWCEGAMASLKKAGHNVRGVGLVGESRDDVSLARDYDALANAIDNFDVCVIHGSEEIAKAVLPACKARGIKSIWIQPYWGVWQGVYDIVNAADLTLAPTEEYAEILSAHTGKNVLAMPFPQDTDAWKYRRRKKSMDVPHVAYVGRVTEAKEVQRIMRPFQIVHSRFPNAKLSIIGPSGDETINDELQRQAQELGLEGAFTRVDKPLSSKEVGEAYATIDVFAFPTVETYGQSNLEAILTGTPVVTFDAVPFGGYRVPSMSWLRDYPYAANPMAKDIWADFAQKIIKVLEDPAEARRKVAPFSRYLREKFSWDALQHDLVDAIKTSLRVAA